MVRNVYLDTPYEIGTPFGIRFNYINTGETDAEIECIEAHVFRSRRNTVNNLRNVLTFKHLSKRELEGWREQRRSYPAGRGWRIT